MRYILNRWSFRSHNWQKIFEQGDIFSCSRAQFLWAKIFSTEVWYVLAYSKRIYYLKGLWILRDLASLICSPIVFVWHFPLKELNQVHPSMTWGFYHYVRQVLTSFRTWILIFLGGFSFNFSNFSIIFTMTDFLMFRTFFERFLPFKFCSFSDIGYMILSLICSIESFIQSSYSKFIESEVLIPSNDVSLELLTFLITVSQ